ncbi:MAG TPA: O-antigen ligase family protein, partial [Bacteroidia bacterium]|nr:O-antigen ligase family protein [Bacteroidia bacterium]
MKKTTSAINGLTIFDKLYFLFFLLLPFVYNNKLVDPVLIPRQLYLTIFNVIILVFVFKKVQKGELIVDISFLKLPVFIFLAAFLAIVLISFFQSILLSESIYVFSKLMIEVVFFLITTYLLIQNQIQLSVIIKTFILLCLIILLKGLYQVIGFSKFSSDFFDNMISVNASFGHKNLLASVLFLTLPFLLASIVLEEKKWKILSIVLSLAVFVFIWLLQAKAVLVACFVFSILVLCFYFLTQKKGVQPFTTKRILAFGIVFILALSIFTYCNKDKFPRLFDKKSSYERIELWRNSAYMFKEHIFLGVGAGNWQIQFPKYGLSNFADPKVKQGITTFQRPHNDFLWVGCELGIMGLLIYPTIFIFMGYYLIKLIRSTDKNWLYRLLLAAIVGYVLIACVDFPLERIEHQLLLFVIFSIVVADYYRLQFSQDKKAKPTTISYLGFLIIPVLLSLLVAVNRFSGEYHTKKLYSFEQTDNWEKMQREADMAINSFYKIDPTSAPIEWYKGVALFSQGNIQDAKQ